MFVDTDHWIIFRVYKIVTAHAQKKCRSYSTGKGHPAAGSIATAFEKNAHAQVCRETKTERRLP